MRFSDDAYTKLYPRQTETVERVESAVASFTPTEDFQTVESEQEVMEDGDAGDGEPVVE